MSIFKAYDIRGVYGDELTQEMAEKIGFFLPKVITGKKIAVGHDMRSSSIPLKEGLINGLLRSGCEVYDVGLISTPMINFAVANYDLDGGVQITASHNPKEYNGFKVAGKNALPVGYDTGLNEVERLVKSEEIHGEKTGKVIKMDIMADYLKHVLSFLKTNESFNIAIDAANGMAGLTVPKIFPKTNLHYDGLYMELDGTFPNHEANPLKEENLVDIKNKVKNGNYDFGIAFDGDADRIMFIDEKGEHIPADIITAMIGEWFVSHGHDGVLYDVRSTKIIKESVEKAGGHAYLCRVGHAYFKKLLRDKNAFFGGELAGHFYFKENFYTDSGVIMLMKMINFLNEKNEKLSVLAKPYRKYFQSGEINSKVDDKDGKINEISTIYNDGKQLRIDGLSVYYKDWWFNLRKSNTEPLLRLCLETDTKELMETKTKEILEKVRGE